MEFKPDLSGDPNGKQTDVHRLTDIQTESDTLNILQCNINVCPFIHQVSE